MIAGTLDEVLSQEFLREGGVTHVLCLLGRDKLHLAKNNRCPDIWYLDWPIGFVPAWNDYPSVLRGLDTVLKSGRNGNVLVHCVNGKDRTALLFFIYLVCCTGRTEDEAWEVIDKKKDRCGATLMNVFGCKMYTHFCQVWNASGGVLPEQSHETLWQLGGS